MTEDPKLPKKQQRRSSSKINIDDTVVRDSLDRARKSLDRSFDKIRAKGPSISDEALSQLIVRKQYNPHNTLSNLWLGSTFKLVFYRFRPWAFSVLHAVFLFLWTRERCPDGEVTCDDPIFPFRESFADFGLGLPEMGPVITMCLFVLTFYCNTCITLYRELYFTLTTISTRMKNLSLFLRVFEDDPKKRWAIIRSAICAETSSVDLSASRRGEKRHASGAERWRDMARASNGILLLTRSRSLPFSLPTASRPPPLSFLRESHPLRRYTLAAHRLLFWKINRRHAEWQGLTELDRDHPGTSPQPPRPFPHFIPHSRIAPICHSNPHLVWFGSSAGGSDRLGVGPSAAAYHKPAARVGPQHPPFPTHAQTGDAAPAGGWLRFSRDTLVREELLTLAEAGPTPPRVRLNVTTRRADAAGGFQLARIALQDGREQPSRAEANHGGRIKLCAHATVLSAQTAEWCARKDLCGNGGQRRRGRLDRGLSETGHDEAVHGGRRDGLVRLSSASTQPLHTASLQRLSAAPLCSASLRAGVEAPCPLETPCEGRSLRVSTL